MKNAQQYLSAITPLIDAAFDLVKCKSCSESLKFARDNKIKLILVGTDARSISIHTQDKALVMVFHIQNPDQEFS
ncbi:MAG TPA: hypothetical protein VH500_22325 [Nitrososphaeraceae archaeon]